MERKSQQKDLTLTQPSTVIYHCSLQAMVREIIRYTFHIRICAVPFLLHVFCNVQLHYKLQSDPSGETSSGTMAQLKIFRRCCQWDFGS